MLLRALVSGSGTGSQDPLIDLWVTKDDLPDPVQKDGLLTYTIVVGNNGPDVATQATLVDPVPAGTSFVSVSTTQGTCTGGALVTCNLGAVPTWPAVTIPLVVRPMVTGLVTNTVTVVGNERESNTANNQATATTRVPCDRFTVTPGRLRVGQRTTVVVRVAAVAKPRKVVMRGAGIYRTGRTDAHGVARIVVTAPHRGIVTITVTQAPQCRGKRIRVIGRVPASRA
jgi:uncharacterized repeat protein (TIGR01451 family)